MRYTINQLILDRLAQTDLTNAEYRLLLVWLAMQPREIQPRCFYARKLGVKHLNHVSDLFKRLLKKKVLLVMGQKQITALYTYHIAHYILHPRITKVLYLPGDEDAMDLHTRMTIMGENTDIGWYDI